MRGLAHNRDAGRTHLTANTNATLEEKEAFDQAIRGGHSANPDPQPPAFPTRSRPNH